MSIQGSAESFVEMCGSLSIPDMIKGKSAYEIAVANGYKGTEKEWLELNKNDYITPQMFRAVGDGVNDDTEAIQAAIDYFIGKAGKIVFPQGQYRITAPLTIKSNIILSGISSAKYGRYNSDIPSTVIFYDGEGAIESMIKYDRDGATVLGGGIYNLTLDGREKADYIVNINKGGRVVIANNSIVFSVKAGIYASYSYENIIRENWIAYNKGHAIILDLVANANVVRDNAISLSDGSSGILLNGCNGNVISGNMIEGGYNSSVGIHITGGDYATQNIITDNRIEFESHRYEGQTEGICILIGAEGSSSKPYRNFVNKNAVFNQVILTSGAGTELNHKNEFIDCGLGTITDFYDNTVLNENPKLFISNGAVTGYSKVDDGIKFTGNADSTNIALTNAVYGYPVFYQPVNVKDLRGENIALSCMMKCNDRTIGVGIEYYKNGTGNTWGTFGTYITAKRVRPIEVGAYHLMQIVDSVPSDCDTAVIVFNFGTDGNPPADANVDLKWCKLSRVATWR
jgi:hypothetical protein